MTWSSMPPPCSPCCGPSPRGAGVPQLEGARIGTVNLAEVVAKLGEDGVPEAQISARDRPARARRARLRCHARLQRRDTTRCDPCPGASASGDRACLALAQSLGAVALTADRSWSRLNLDIAIEVILLVPGFSPVAFEPGLDLVALDLAGGAARQVGEGDEADLLGLLVAGELLRGTWRSSSSALRRSSLRAITATGTSPQRASAGAPPPRRRPAGRRAARARSRPDRRSRRPT